jgi:hypothetical protein
MTEQPTWFLRLQSDLPAPVEIPCAVIDWIQCHDLFLILLLQRLEGRCSSPHPAAVRRLLQRRVSGEALASELEASSGWAASSAAADWATAAALAAELDAVEGERTAQLADLQAAVAASTQQPDGYLDINLRGIHAAIAQAASGFIVPTPPASPVPVSERLPGAEDCDAEGLCWWWSRDITAWCLCFAADGDSSEWTHWLPHWAIPQPQTGDVQP